MVSLKIVLNVLWKKFKLQNTIILVIDEVHNLIGAGAAEGAVDAANILKPALARGELTVYWCDYNRRISKAY